MTSFWNPKLADRNIRERFEKGRIAVDGRVRMTGLQATAGRCRDSRSSRTIFPWGQAMFSYSIFTSFPNFAGGQSIGFSPATSCDALAAEGASRAFADTGEWNQAQLRLFKMTPFRLFGIGQIITMYLAIS